MQEEFDADRKQLLLSAKRDKEQASAAIRGEAITAQARSEKMDNTREAATIQQMKQWSSSEGVRCYAPAPEPAGESKKVDDKRASFRGLLWHQHRQTYCYRNMYDRNNNFLKFG